jgi:uncharacterized membrane protein
MTLVPAWAPNLHPIVVHFPIALLVTAAALDVLSWVMGRHRWLRSVATSLFVLGTAGTVVAYLTGQAAEQSVWLPGMAHAVVGAHGTWARRTVWFFAAMTLCRLIALRLSRHEPGPVLVATLVLAGMVGVGLLYETGDRGAQLVFQYGVGTLNP